MPWGCRWLRCWHHWKPASVPLLLRPRNPLHTAVQLYTDIFPLSSRTLGHRPPACGYSACLHPWGRARSGRARGQAPRPSRLLPAVRPDHLIEGVPHAGLDHLEEPESPPHADAPGRPPRLLPLPAGFGHIAQPVLTQVPRNPHQGARPLRTRVRPGALGFQTEPTDHPEQGEDQHGGHAFLPPDVLGIPQESQPYPECEPHRPQFKQEPCNRTVCWHRLAPHAGAHAASCARRSWVAVRTSAPSPVAV